MKPVTQTVTGPKGNCWAACLASLLELDISEVPDLQAYDKHANWMHLTNEWLATFGYGFMEFTSEPEFFSVFGLNTYHIICGPSPRRTEIETELSHAVVGLNGKMVHDPHPSGDGLTSVSVYAVLLKLFN